MMDNTISGLVTLVILVCSAGIYCCCCIYFIRIILFIFAVNLIQQEHHTYFIFTAISELITPPSTTANTNNYGCAVIESAYHRERCGENDAVRPSHTRVRCVQNHQRKSDGCVLKWTTFVDLF